MIGKLLIGILLAGVVGSACTDEAVEPVSTESVKVENAIVETVEQNPVKEEQKKEIVYVKYGINEMYKDLEENAMRAEKKYNKQYLELTGYIKVIDSDGEYFSIASNPDTFLPDTIHCNFTSEEQKEIFINDYNKDDKITIKCKVSSIGELQGYQVKIKEIVKK